MTWTPFNCLIYPEIYGRHRAVRVPDAVTDCRGCAGIRDGNDAAGSGSDAIRRTIIDYGAENEVTVSLRSGGQSREAKCLGYARAGRPGIDITQW